ncbi:MAG: hypothetical protein GY714_20015 [Desulfobacterales bacterium]|nr:hypothetical protein [Desulfobacterales bacterium]
MLKDYIYQQKRKARDGYRGKVREIENNKKKLLQRRLLVIKLQKTFKNCPVLDNYSRITLHLTKEYNVAKDFALFLEQEERFLTIVGGSKEYTVNHYQNTSLDHTWKDLTIDVYYGEGKCERVLIGSNSKVVNTPIYEVKCL